MQAPQQCDASFKKGIILYVACTKDGTSHKLMECHLLKMKELVMPFINIAEKGL